MNWLDFQQSVYSLTQEDVEELNKEIIATYKAAREDITAQIEKQYAKYLTSIGTDDVYNEMLKYNRLQNLLSDVTTAYNAYSLKAQTLTEHVVSISASNTYYRSLYASAWLDGGLYGVLPYEMAELIVYGTAETWKAIPASIAARFGGDLAAYTSKAGTLTEFLVKNRKEEIRQIQNAIVTGLQQGKSYKQMSEIIAGIIGKVTKKDGVLTASGAMANAMRIAITEGNRAMNAASFAASSYLDGQGVDIQKRWLATLDSRTRSKHAHLDGKTIPVDERFPGGAMYPGDFPSAGQNINCRCTTIDIIDGEGPELRTGRNPTTGESGVMNWKDFAAWAKDHGLTRNKYGELYEK